MGASFIAFERWLKFAPRDSHCSSVVSNWLEMLFRISLTAMSNAGKVATTAAVKTRVMINGGLLGSVLKV